MKKDLDVSMVRTTAGYHGEERNAHASEAEAATAEAAGIESRAPDVGSSRNSRAGSVTSSTPTDRRRRSPPLTPRANSVPTRVPRHFCRPCRG